MNFDPEQNIKRGITNLVVISVVAATVIITIIFVLIRVAFHQ